MGRIRGLLCRSGSFYARVVVPPALRSAMGKTELRERLGTDRRAAERDVYAAMARFHDQLSQARQSVPLKASPGPSFPTLSDIARAHYSEELARDDFDRMLTAMHGPTPTLRGAKETYKKSLLRVASRQTSNDEMAAVIGWAIDRFAPHKSEALIRGSSQWRELGYLLASVHLEALERVAERNQGDFTGNPKLPILDPKASHEGQADSSDVSRVLGPESELPLSEIVLLMHREKRNVRLSTQQEQRVAVRYFEEFLGEPMPMHKITRRMIIQYKAALPDVPVLYTQRFSGRSLPEAIEANKKRAKPYPTLSPVTINRKWLTHLKSVFAWAFANGFIPDNPAQGVRLDGGKSDPKPSKVPFTSSDIEAIVRSEAFRGPLGERQWAVLIGLHTGMRASEIAQLRLDGVRRERGILVFAVDGELKNEASRRLVPIHSALLERGLDQRVAKLRSAGQTHLFPEWYARAQEIVRAAEKKGKAVHQPYAAVHPKWFNRYLLPKVKISTERKSFHCLRHTFKTALSVAGVPRDISDALTGHRDYGAGGGYVHSVSMEAMSVAVEKLNFLPE